MQAKTATKKKLQRSNYSQIWIMLLEHEMVPKSIYKEDE